MTNQQDIVERATFSLGLACVSIDISVAASLHGRKRIACREENWWINWLSPLSHTMIESRSIGFGAFSKWLNGLREMPKGK
jgi:hypothetical protein